MSRRLAGPFEEFATCEKAMCTALKPGGVQIVLDHVAIRHSPVGVTDTLRRIDPSMVRREVEAAGFKFGSESAILTNPADPHTVTVFDNSIRGHTDRFICTAPDQSPQRAAIPEALSGSPDAIT